jgi:predicted RNA-binding Zn ribbon-like protein
MSTSQLSGPALLPAADEPVPVLLMNTLWADRSGVHDGLTSTQELAAWLAAVGDRLPGAPGAQAPVRKADVVKFRELRTALRRVAAEATEDPRPVAVTTRADVPLRRAVDLINRVSAIAPPAPSLQVPEWEGTLRPAPGSPPANAALSAVAGLAVGLFDRSTSAPLRACLAPGCVLYFAKDHPRREWCSDSCGNRARAARHYSRRRHGATIADPRT